MHPIESSFSYSFVEYWGNDIYLWAIPYVAMIIFVSQLSISKSKLQQRHGSDSISFVGWIARMGVLPRSNGPDLNETRVIFGGGLGFFSSSTPQQEGAWGWVRVRSNDHSAVVVSVSGRVYSICTCEKRRESINTFVVSIFWISALLYCGILYIKVQCPVSLSSPSVFLAPLNDWCLIPMFNRWRWNKHMG